MDYEGHVHKSIYMPIELGKIIDYQKSLYGRSVNKIIVELIELGLIKQREDYKMNYKINYLIEQMTKFLDQEHDTGIK